MNNGINNVLLAVFIAIILTFMETIAQSALRHYYLKKEKNIIYPIICWGIYAIVPFLLYYSYSFVEEGVIEVFWDAGTTIMVPLAALVLFSENMTPLGWFGIVVTTIGTIIVGAASI
jgi:multidrug transporter EmrE-like cation transporter